MANGDNTENQTADLSATEQREISLNTNVVDVSKVNSESPPAIRELALVPVPIATQEEGDIKKRQAALERLFAAADYRKATLVATKIVNALTRAFGDRDLRLAPALINLATCQYHGDDLSNAIANFQQAVRLSETSGNFRDPRLIAPLAGLGVSFYKAGSYPEAIEALERSAFIARADAGLQNLKQLENDNVLMRSYIASGRVEDASDRQKVHLQIVEQALESGPELESARLQAVKWYRLMGDYDEEAKIHEKRSRELRKDSGSKDPGLIPIYQDLALAYRRVIEEDLSRLKAIKNRGNSDFAAFRGYSSAGVNPNSDFMLPMDQILLDTERDAYNLLRRTLRMQKRDKSTKPEDQAKTWILMGDHQTVVESGRRGRRSYERAYKLLKKHNREDLIALYFGLPVALYKSPIRAPQTNDPTVLAAFTGEAEIEMDINSIGNTYNVSIKSLKPNSAKFLENRILYSARKMVFRPRFDDSGALITKKFTYTYQLLPAMHENNLNPNQVEINAN